MSYNPRILKSLSPSKVFNFDEKLVNAACIDAIHDLLSRMINEDALDHVLMINKFMQITHIQEFKKNVLQPFLYKRKNGTVAVQSPDALRTAHMSKHPLENGYVLEISFEGEAHWRKILKDDFDESDSHRHTPLPEAQEQVENFEKFIKNVNYLTFDSSAGVNNDESVNLRTKVTTPVATDPGFAFGGTPPNIGFESTENIYQIKMGTYTFQIYNGLIANQTMNENKIDTTKLQNIVSVFYDRSIVCQSETPLKKPSDITASKRYSANAMYDITRPLISQMKTQKPVDANSLCKFMCAILTKLSGDFGQHITGYCHTTYDTFSTFLTSYIQLPDHPKNFTCSIGKVKGRTVYLFDRTLNAALKSALSKRGGKAIPFPEFISIMRSSYSDKQEVLAKLNLIFPEPVARVDMSIGTYPIEEDTTPSAIGQEVDIDTTGSDEVDNNGIEIDSIPEPAAQGPNPADPMFDSFIDWDNDTAPLDELFNKDITAYNLEKIFPLPWETFGQGLVLPIIPEDDEMTSDALNLKLSNDDDYTDTTEKIWRGISQFGNGGWDDESEKNEIASIRLRAIENTAEQIHQMSSLPGLDAKAYEALKNNAIRQNGITYVRSVSESRGRSQVPEPQTPKGLGFFSMFNSTQGQNGMTPETQRHNESKKRKVEQVDPNQVDPNQIGGKKNVDTLSIKIGGLSIKSPGKTTVKMV